MQRTNLLDSDEVKAKELTNRILYSKDGINPFNRSHLLLAESQLNILIMPLSTTRTAYGLALIAEMHAANGDESDAIRVAKLAASLDPDSCNNVDSMVGYIYNKFVSHSSTPKF